MKKFRHALSFLLVFVMLFSTSVPAFATSFPPESENSSVIVTDSGVYINDVYYAQEQFVQLLEAAQEIETETGNQTRSAAAAALVAGTWYIPGIGQVIVTAAGAVLVAGVVVEVGSWIYDTVVEWFATRAFNKSAEDAVNNCNSNKQNHIMQSKHNWNKFNKDPKWSDVAPILIEVLKKGSEKWETGDQYIRTLVYQGETVVVRFIKDAEGLVKYISTAWCK